MADPNTKDDSGPTSTEPMVDADAHADAEEDFVTLGNIDDDRDDDGNEDSGNDDDNNREERFQDLDSSTPQQQQEQDESQLVARPFDLLRDLPPWMSAPVDYRRTNRMVALHNEVVGFCKLMEPKPAEMSQREQLVQRFTALAHSTFRNAKVDVFGSQATGLCLPTSDIDIAIQLSEQDSPKDDDGAENAEANGDEKKKQKTTIKAQELEDMKNWDAPTGSPLRRLADALRDQWMEELAYLEVIEKTRVPLVKFTHGPTNISVDVCFNQTTGVQAATLMHRYMDALPPLRPLTFVLKYFMASRGLNQPYSGGMGSFLLQMMIVSFLQQRERESQYNRRPTNCNLGVLLVEFFEFYSMDFNFITTGISVRFDGYYFPKGAADRKSDFWKADRPFSFAMENPLEPTMDVGAPSFRIFMVQRSFEIAFKVMLSHVTQPFQPTVSILASILPPTDEMRKRSTTTSMGRGRSTHPDGGNHQNNNNNNNNNHGGSMRSPPRKRQRR